MIMTFYSIYCSLLSEEYDIGMFLDRSEVLTILKVKLFQYRPPCFQISGNEARVEVEENECVSGRVTFED